MDYKHLGRSGLSASRLCLGTMNFGPDELARLDEIWPGHQTAPEDYAW